MIIHFTEADLEFLHAVGVAPESSDASIKVAHPDETVLLLEEFDIPVTRENYLRLAFMGKPPEEPLDGEIEIQLPKELQRYNDDEED
jgi:hypothetical protein